MKVFLFPEINAICISAIAFTDDLKNWYGIF